MRATRDKTCEMRHIDHEVRAHFVRDLAHAREVKLARIGASAPDDHLRALALGLLLKLIVINRFRVFAHLIAGRLV